MTRPNDPMKLDLSNAETVALVSTERPQAPRWSELQVWFLPDVTGRCFVAEARGMSNVPGDVTKRQRVYVGTLERALEMFDETDAGENVRLMAFDWLDRNPDRVRDEIKQLRHAAGQVFGAPTVPPKIQFDGAGGLAGALSWLYQPAGIPTENKQVDAFSTDFGISDRTVRHSLQLERAGEKLPSWARAFVGALMFFNREAFHASKGGA